MLRTRARTPSASKCEIRRSVYYLYYYRPALGTTGLPRVSRARLGACVRALLPASSRIPAASRTCTFGVSVSLASRRSFRLSRISFPFLAFRLSSLLGLYDHTNRVVLIRSCFVSLSMLLALCRFRFPPILVFARVLLAHPSCPGPSSRTCPSHRILCRIQHHPPHLSPHRTLAFPPTLS
ncbi:hypothetical protein OH77DRAFT_117300 [Trametes cingulata]|nr:hypothetical protein OH77DRAFT_117300 [Trametes cingulata]